MQFKEIIGQETIKKRFLKMVTENRISHAQLLLGKEGCGKLGLAIAFAQYVCCTDRQDNDSCGTCPSCRKIEKLVHPDLHFVFPVVRSSKFKQPVSDNYIRQWRSLVTESPYFGFNDWLMKMGAENQQAGIFTHESQEIIRKLNLKTYESEYKIMIIWMPEKMNVVAANKLLKMIEEPPPKTLFLLVGEDSEMIINTILSRTQLVKVPRIDDQSMKTALKNRFEIAEDELNNAVNVANGNYIKALDAINRNEENKEHFMQFVQLMRMAYGRKIVSIVQWADEIGRFGREKQKRFLQYAMLQVRENYVQNKASQLKDKLVYLPKEEAAFADKFSAFINDSNITKLNEELNRAHYHIERNASGKIVFLDLSLKIVKLIRPKKKKR